MAACLITAFIVAACGSGTTAQQADPVQPRVLPSPSEPLPHDPGALARRLTQVSDALGGSVDTWLAAGDPSRDTPPEPLTLQALYVQRAYRLLARRPHLAAQTLARVPARLRRPASDTVAALHDLMRLTPRTHRRSFKTGRPEPPGRLLAFYRQAQRRFGVAWNVLASVNFVETDFNRIRSSSSAGAQGPMQFMPSTWREYGLGGDLHDPHDAILGAANYLHRSGAPRSYHRAVYAYNPSPLYVDAVLRYARRLAANRRAFYEYFAWQVFVRTPSGDRRLTGP